MNDSKKQILMLATAIMALLEMGPPNSAQLNAQAISGRVTNAINQAPEPEVLVRLWSQDGPNLTGTTDANGRYGFRLDAPLRKPAFLLFNKLGYLTQITKINPAGARPYDAQLKKAIFQPEDIQLLGFVAKAGGQAEAKIAGATVYVNGGVYRVNTDQRGFFQLPISLEPGIDETLIWIEAEHYQPKIDSLADLRDRDQTKMLPFELVPSINKYSFQFRVIRDDTKEPLKDVEIRINDIKFDKTDESGAFTTTYFPERSDYAANVVDFSHPQFIALRQSYNVSRFNVNESIALQPPTFNIEPLVYYQAENGSLQPLSEVKYQVLQKNRASSEIRSRPRLVFQALVGDTLRAELAPTANNDLERFPERSKDFRLFNGMASLYWRVEKSPLTLRIKIDSSEGYENGQEVELFVVQGKEWFKAERKDGNLFEIESNRLDSLSHSSWQVRVISSRHEPIPQWVGFDWSTYTETIRLKQRAAALASLKEAEKLPGKGIVKIETKPAAAEISLEGIPVQQKKLSPDTLLLPEGRHALSIKKGGYVPYYRVVEVKRDSTIALTVDLGDPFTPLSRQSKIKIAPEIGLMGWILRYREQKNGAFPTLRAGGHLFYHVSPQFGVKFSYFASKIPTYYLDQIFAAGVFVGDKRLHASVEFRENTFEASKEVLAKFDGRSLHTNLWLCLGAENASVERLPLLEQYRRAVIFGYETSFGTINKTVSESLPREQELSIGLMFRVGRGFIEGRGGIILDDVAVINERTKARQNAGIARISVRYLYFLN